MAFLQSNGSSRFRIGATEVIASVKVLDGLDAQLFRFVGLWNSFNEISYLVFSIKPWSSYCTWYMFEQVQAELGRPSALHPDKGKIFINVDCSPTAAPIFEVSIYVICYISFFTLQSRLNRHFCLFTVHQLCGTIVMKKLVNFIIHAHTHTHFNILFVCQLKPSL